MDSVYMHKEIMQGVLEKYPKTNPKVIEQLIKVYNRELMKSLLDNGYTYVSDCIRLEIVPITKRRYVLRGTEYTSQKLYKIKATMDDNFYDKLYEEYNKFREVD